MGAEKNKGLGMMMKGLANQNAELSRRAYESRVREAQEAAEMKMRTVQQMCEELAEQGRRKKQLQEDLDKGMKNNEAKRIQSRIDKANEDAKAQREMREQLMQDEFRAQATAAHVAKKQAEQNACVALYERTAGKANNDRENAELTRIDNDEKKHLMRTDAYFGQRERARERQRQNMVTELDRQMAACGQKRKNDQLAKQAEREAIQSATKRSMDAELKKAMDKKAEGMELQRELRIMMLEKEEKERKEGTSRPTAMATMNMVMSKNGTYAAHAISDLHKSMEAARFMGKPLGRDESGPVPLDASPSTLRKLTRDQPFTKVPHDTVLGGVVGTLGGGGGPVNTALMATGGKFLPKSIGLAIQDVKLDTHWHQGLRP